ncbi:MAG TPA: sigma-70 family RNA polymerase sigma factor [Gemmata sp.]|nr:sigma-70 family RNA polymerase sigma factor [Gemmata sp.]
MRTVSCQLVHYLSTVTDHRTDGELLGGFLNHNAEADFAELVRRHGPLVWGACRRALPDRTDAEDAFQTVFLVLVQRGHRLVGSTNLGPWLHRVAVWTTRNVRRRNARRLARREMLHEQIPISSQNVDLSLDLDTALMSLPEKFRSSIVLCHLLGFSRADAAAQLGCAERTLSSWLSRGLAQLRHKLRDLDPMKALSVPVAAVPAALSESVVHAAVSLQSASVAASVLSPTISQLVEGVIRMFWVKKATAVSVAMFTMFAFGVGVGVSTHQLAPAAGGEEKIGVTPSVTKVHKQTDPDEANVAELETSIAVTSLTIYAKKAEMEALSKNLGTNLLTPQEFEKYRDVLKQDTDAATKKLEELQNKLKQLQKLKALKALEKLAAQQPKPTEANKNQPPAQQDLDNKLVELEARLRKLHAESQILQAQNAARLQELKAQIEVVTASIIDLKKEKEKAKEKAPEIKQSVDKTKGGHLELMLDVKLGQKIQSVGLNAPDFPFQVKEVGADGKIVGSVYFTNAEVLGRYLARTMKDANGPKELRIVTRADTPANLLLAAIEAGKAAGFKDVVVARDGVNDAAAATTALAEYYRALGVKNAQEQNDKMKLENEKVQKEGQLQLLEQLLKEKEEEIRKLKEQKKPVKPGTKPGADQEQEAMIRDLEEILKKKIDELRMLRDLEQFNKNVKPTSPQKP